MAKSMRVNRNKRYSKKRRTNNRATSRKSARREKKRNSRRNNRRNLRGGMGVGTGGQVAAQVEGFDNPLYAAIKDRTNDADAVAELVTKITDVMKLLSENILLKLPFEQKDISADSELSKAINDAHSYVDSIASKTDLDGDYEDANLTGLLILLDGLKGVKPSTSDDEYLKAIQEYINKLGVFAASYNFEKKQELDDFRTRLSSF